MTKRRGWMLSSARILSAAMGVLLLGVSCVATADPAGAAPMPEHGAQLAGWDTYRRLDRLPYLSAGTQALQLSSFDRTGGDYNVYTGNTASSTANGTWCDPTTARPHSSTHSRPTPSRLATKSTPPTRAAGLCTATATPTSPTSL